MTTTNPLLAPLRLPGARFQLPSQGIFYQNGELAENVTNGEVEVYPLTAIDEIILGTPDKLLSGGAIIEVFARCIPEVLKPNELLTRDVDFLMACLRQVSFGETMDVTYRHDCHEKAKEHTYTVDIAKMIRATKKIDPTTISSEYSHTLPNGQIVALKPLTYGNAIELYQTAAFSKLDEISQEDAEKLVVDTLVNVIKQVDETTDKTMIKEWVIALPLGWKKQLERAAQSVSQWGIEFVTHQKCKDCKEAMSFQVSPNPVSFFT